MKPIIIAHPDTLSGEQLKKLQRNDICVVISKNPEAIKVFNPVPDIPSTEPGLLERTAILFTRKVTSRSFWQDDTTRKLMAATYYEILVNNSCLDPNGTEQERQNQHFKDEKYRELSRLAREEAKAEKLKQKQAQTKPA